MSVYTVGLKLAILVNSLYSKCEVGYFILVYTVGVMLAILVDIYTVGDKLAVLVDSL